MQTIAPLWLWATFGGLVLVSLFLDFVGCWRASNIPQRYATPES
jgi:hypothetical protein